jgi:hypothetical protein
MPRINPTLITVVYITLILAFAVCLGFGVRRLPDVGQARSETEVWIYKNHDITQKITPVHNGLNVLTIYMRNIGLRNRQPLNFSLLDQKGDVIREIALNGYNVGDGDSVRFQFAPIVDSGGKSYQIVLSSPTSVYKDAIGVGFYAGSISYEAYYFPEGKLAVVRDVVSTLFARLFSIRFIVMFVILGAIAFLCLNFGY